MQYRCTKVENNDPVNNLSDHETHCSEVENYHWMNAVNIVNDGNGRSFSFKISSLEPFTVYVLQLRSRMKNFHHQCKIEICDDKYKLSETKKILNSPPIFRYFSTRGGCKKSGKCPYFHPWKERGSGNKCRGRGKGKLK